MESSTTTTNVRPTVIIIPGFGGTKEVMLKKLRIFHHNVQFLHQQRSAVVWIVRLYTPEHNSLFDESIKYFEKTYTTQTFCWYTQPGQMGPFLRDCCKQLWTSFSDDSSIIIMLDDIELCPSVNLGTMKQMMQKYALDILSPSLHTQSVSCHRFMRASYPVIYTPLLRITNFAELFLYMFTKTSFGAYLELIPPDTEYMWGVDMLLYPYAHMKIGILNTMFIIHHISSKLENNVMYEEMLQELRQTSRQFPNNLKFKFKDLQHIHSP